MKVIIKNPEGSQTRVVTLRLPESVMQEIDRLAEGNGISRQKLIAEILKKVVTDKAFTVEVTAGRADED